MVVDFKGKAVPKHISFYGLQSGRFYEIMTLENPHETSWSVGNVVLVTKFNEHIVVSDLLSQTRAHSESMTNNAKFRELSAGESFTVTI